MKRSTTLLLIVFEILLQIPHAHSAFSSTRYINGNHIRSSPSQTIRTPSFYSLAKKPFQESTPNKDVWQSFYNGLLQFKSANGNLNIPEDDPYNQDLRAWTIEQKRQYVLMKSGKKSKITKKRAAALEQIGLVNPM